MATLFGLILVGLLGVVMGGLATYDVLRQKGMLRPSDAAVEAQAITHRAIESILREYDQTATNIMNIAEVEVIDPEGSIDVEGRA